MNRKQELSILLAICDSIKLKEEMYQKQKDQMISDKRWADAHGFECISSGLLIAQNIIRQEIWTIQRKRVTSKKH